jgi:DNA-binding NtrC family response regulator
VLSDINLGDVTGYDVFHAARRASQTLPVILMTGFGYDPHHSIVRATQEGLRGVLFKPFQAERLVEEVRNVFVGPTATQPPGS